jgi:hypothetical protein
VKRQEAKLPLISQTKLAERWDVHPRTLARRQKADLNFPRSRIINGYHFYDEDEVAAYERRLASLPRVAKPAPVARSKSPAPERAG